MNTVWTWAAVAATASVLLLYEVLLVLLQSRRPERLARARHAGLREDWFLAVQTLRNSLMSATMLASTAALVLMGTVTLAAPSLHASFDTARGLSDVSPRLVLELVLLALLFASLVSTMRPQAFSWAAFYRCISR